MTDATDVDALKTFALEMWRLRAAENGSPEPTDLSGACKFCALLAQMEFGGRIEAHDFHAWLVVDGVVVDLAEDGDDVARLADGLVPLGAEEYARVWGVEWNGDDPHEEDAAFTASPGFAESLDSCRPRAVRWHGEWRRRKGAEGLRPHDA